KSFEGLGLDRAHPRFIGNVLKAQPSRRADALENLVSVTVDSGASTADLLSALVSSTPSVAKSFTLTGGNDGVAPTAAEYQDALALFERLEDISIVAAPGHTAYTDAQAITLALISHAEKRRSYRIAVLDTPPNMIVGEARDWRSKIDSKYAALYYPWV